MENIGERIIKIRKEKMLSQELLAEKIGVSRQAISKWERNEALPDVNNLIMLSKVFNISIDEIINDNKEKNKNEQVIKRLDMRYKSERLIIISIILYILSFFTMPILPFKEEINVLIFGITIAAATGMIIYGSFLGDRFKLINSLKLKKIQKDKKDKM